MKLIERNERHNYIYDDSSSNLFGNINFGLKFIGVVSNYSNISIKSIDISDGINHSEGVIDTVISDIDNIKDFIEKYKNEKLKYVLALGEYNKSKITICVFFDSKVIELDILKN